MSAVFAWALLLILTAVVVAAENNNEEQAHSTSMLKQQRIQELRQIAYTHPEGSEQALQAWQTVLQIDPKNLEARVIMGWSLLFTGNPGHSELGIHLLEESFDKSKVHSTIDAKFPQTFLIAATIGRYRSQRHEFPTAHNFTKRALNLSHFHGGHVARQTDDDPSKQQQQQQHLPKTGTEHGDVCVQMQLATMFDYFPESIQAADHAIADMNFYAQRLLAQPDWAIDEGYLAQFPGASTDSYVHCMLSAFYLSFYYRANITQIASQHYEMARRGWPALDTTADFVHDYQRIGPTADHHPCIRRKIKLLVISAVMTEGHSNTESFGGVMARLDRNIFGVTYVLVVEPTMVSAQIASFTRAHASDRVLVWHRDDVSDNGNGAWTTRLGQQIAEWQMDIIFYFDLTMSTYVRRLGMQRLAPVQINSLGHPITSGHPHSIIQYYVSWAAAELPIEQAQTHYTEKLWLLPNDHMHLYYERRILPGGKSRMDGQAFGHLTRSDFDLPVDDDTRIYLCMQKPFKFHPEFDTLVCGVMQQDLEAHIVLHQEVSPANQQVFVARLQKAGCDLQRITFLEQQPHHRLLALYRESTVVMDSYPAGGDTTTREVLEMGKPLVTLPARLLGGRWSAAYMNAIGLEDATKEALIASTPEGFIERVVKLGKYDSLREAVEADIRKSVPNLFQQDVAVKAWEKMFLDVSPYRMCSHVANSTEKGRVHSNDDEL